jgi:hypothetical protein
MRIRLSGIFIFLFTFLIIIGSNPLLSQENSTISPYIQLQYFKNTDDQKYLQTALTYSADRMEKPLPGMEISFYSDARTRNLLGTVLTDEKGIAKLDLTNTDALAKNSDGYWSFSTEYSGNDTIEGGTSELLIRDVDLQMTLEEVDSIKTISLTALADVNGARTPVSGDLVMIYIPRMFSLLPVGEAYLDENGNSVLEFPSDLPGDTEGNLTIIARIEEHPDFGTIEKRSTVKWGVPFVNPTPMAHRALWTKTPPWWMIITLSVLLTGVWGHYFFAVISLFLIKKESKKEDKDRNLI